LAYVIAAPHSLCLAGTSHCCTAISSLHSIRLPAHLPPNRRFGVGPFGRRIPRRNATDLVLFCLAGAFPAEPPLIWCCSIWPAHSPPSRHRFGVVPFGQRIPRRAATDLVLFHLASKFPADLVSSFAGAFAANPPIWCCSIWLAHPLAAPPLPILAVTSPRCATFAYLGWRIPSPIFRWRIPSPFHHRSFWPAHPLAVPPLPT